MSIIYKVDSEGTLTYSIKKPKIGTVNINIPLAEMHVGIQKGGNSKTGKEWLLNTLPGEHEITVKGEPITNVKGSCQGCCDGCEKFCYAISGCQNHHNSVMPSVIKNLLIYRLDPKRFENEIENELSKWKVKDNDKKVFRWHASGEIEDYPYLEMMMRIAQNHPDIHFYSYTKRFGMIERYLDKYHDLPSNFIMNLSVWETNLKDSGFNTAYLSKVQCFEWKDKMSVEEYNHSIHCMSVTHDKEGEKKGHLNHEMNCKKCGLCWKGNCKGKTIYVYNH
jgi:hypothetical protein